MPVIFNGFTNGFQGWTAPGATLTHEDGFIRAVDLDFSSFYFTGGAQWRGDLSDNYGGALTFNMRYADPGGSFSGPDLRITGTNGDVIVNSFLSDPGSSFSSQRIKLDVYSGWTVNSTSGNIASESYIKDILASVASFEIRGENNGSPDQADLTTVLLSRGRPDKIAAQDSDSVISNFNKGGEGWTFINDVAGFSVKPSGGASGGYFELIDAASGGVMFMVAPDAYLGQKSGFMDGTLSFFLKVDSSNSFFGWEDVYLTGGNGVTLAWTGMGDIANAWTKVSVALNSTENWRHDSSTGAVATDADIQSVLDDLTSLRIRGELKNGSETVGFDQVRLEAKKGRYDITGEDTSDLLFTTNLFSEAIDELTRGSTLHVGGKKERDGTYFIDENNVTIDDQLLITGKIVLGNGVKKITVFDGGDGLTVQGNGLDNRIFVSSPNTDTALTVAGGGGNDRIIAHLNDGNTKDIKYFGGAGNDTIIGSDANEQIFGGANQDTLIGSEGNDKMAGGAGKDTFVFQDLDQIGRTNGIDRITDFTSGQDKLDFSSLDGVESLADLSFGMAGLRLVIDYGQGRIILDGISDQSELSASDFIF